VLSPKSAGLAKELGYTNVKVYRDGLPDWKKAGKPTVIAAAAVEKLVAEASKTADAPPFFLILDLRSPQDIEKGHMPFATAMSAQKLIDSISEIPKDKKAQIILCTEKGITPDAVKALQELYKEKYRNPVILTGGFEAWQKAGHKVAAGKAAEKISYRKKLTPEEISIAEFLEIVEKKPGDKLVVDVRTLEDHKGGTVEGTTHCPLEAIQKDVSQLPKDKEVIVYCNTGATSYTAYQVLKQKGFKARYLNANITYKDGKPTISE
jgi:rhodanese-related sulfurtransferase